MHSLRKNIEDSNLLRSVVLLFLRKWTQTERKKSEFFAFIFAFFSLVSSSSLSSFLSAAIHSSNDFVYVFFSLVVSSSSIASDIFQFICRGKCRRFHSCKEYSFRKRTTDLQTSRMTLKNMLELWINLREYLGICIVCVSVSV